MNSVPRFFGFVGVLLAVSTSVVAPVGRANVIAEWTMPVGFPNGPGNIPVGTTYSPPNETTVGSNTGTFPLGGPAYPQGTPTFGLLAGNTAAILSGFHASGSTSWTSPAGNGSTYAFSSNFWSINDYYQIVLPTIGYTSIQVAWDQTRSSSGPASFSLRTSSDGSSFTEVTPYTVGTNTWSTSTYNPLSSSTVSLSANADNQSSLWIRFQATSGPTSTNGTNRIDNIRVTGVPEPASLVLGGLGIAGIGLAIARRRMSRRRA